MSNQQSASLIGSREMLMDSLKSLTETSEEMFIKVYELRSLVQEVKAIREEMNYLKVTLNAAAEEWGIDNLTEKNEK